MTQVQQIRRRHGWLAAFRYAVYRLLQRLAVMDVTHFMVHELADVRASELPVGTECRLLSAAEVREFARDPSNDISVELVNRLEGAWDLCFGAVVNGRLACYGWYALHSIEAENNSATGEAKSGIALSFGDNYAFRYKGFTHPDFRGQRLYSLTAEHAAIALRHQGIDYVLSTAEWVNFSALKSSYRSGYRQLGWLAVLHVAGFRWVHYPRLFDHAVRFDRHAQVRTRSSEPATAATDCTTPNEMVATLP